MTAAGVPGERIGIRAALARLGRDVGVLLRELALSGVERLPAASPATPARQTKPAAVDGPPQAWLDYVAAHDPVWVGERPGPPEDAADPGLPPVAVEPPEPRRRPVAETPPGRRLLGPRAVPPTPAEPPTATPAVPDLPGPPVPSARRAWPESSEAPSPDRSTAYRTSRPPTPVPAVDRTPADHPRPSPAKNLEPGRPEPARPPDQDPPSPSLPTRTSSAPEAVRQGDRPRPRFVPVTPPARPAGRPAVPVRSTPPPDVPAAAPDVRARLSGPLGTPPRSDPSPAAEATGSARSTVPPVLAAAPQSLTPRPSRWPDLPEAVADEADGAEGTVARLWRRLEADGPDPLITAQRRR